MTRRQKIKQWISDHQDTIFVVGVVGSVSAGFILLVRAQAKAHQRTVEMENDWVDELNHLLELERIAEMNARMTHLIEKPDVA